jgi:membrane-bound metal-dependent hydrolase YbcI (DUF457 family)
MPFTPYHFGPSACIALPLRKYIDIPVFILANVAVDLEPLAVILFGLNYPLHGYFHTFLVGTVVALAWGLIAYWEKSILQRLMKLFHLSYQSNFRKMLLSAILGIWFHILLDGQLYTDIQPFWPFKANPLYGLLGYKAVYLICKISFLPAIFLYIIAVASYIRKNKAKNSG